MVEIRYNVPTSAALSMDEVAVKCTVTPSPIWAHSVVKIIQTGNYHTEYTVRFPDWKSHHCHSATSACTNVLTNMEKKPLTTAMHNLCWIDHDSFKTFCILHLCNICWRKKREETLREMMQGNRVSVWIIKLLTSTFKINKILKFHIVFYFCLMQSSSLEVDKRNQCFVVNLEAYWIISNLQ